MSQTQSLSTFISNNVTNAPMLRGLPEVHGTCDDKFQPVRETLLENFRKRGEWGASVCVWHQGKKVVDIWAGLANRETNTPWQQDTITTFFSATKGLVGLCFLMLADRGKIDYAAPLQKYWPETKGQPAGEVTVAQLLNHTSGLITVDEPVTLDMIENEWDRVADILARQAPVWKPGSDQGYHGVTYGLYAQELFRRITGESLGSFIAREIAEPLGADVYLGLPEEHEHRMARNYPLTSFEKATKLLPKLLLHRGVEGRVYRQIALGKVSAKAFAHPKEVGPLGIDNFNTRRVHKLELAWGNGIGNARGLSRVYAALANGGSIDGVKLVSKETLELLYPRESWTEFDQVLRKPQGWSYGFLKCAPTMFSPNTESFGHAGAGGHLGWGDPIANVAIGYTMNHMDHRIRSPRALAIAHAVYDSLGLR